MAKRTINMLEELAKERAASGELDVNAAPADVSYEVAAPAPGIEVVDQAMSGPTEVQVDAAPRKKKFSEAFAEARSAGAKEFEWEGGKYTTQLKEEAKPAAKPAPVQTQARATPQAPGLSAITNTNTKSLVPGQLGQMGLSLPTTTPEPQAPAPRASSMLPKAMKPQETFNEALRKANQAQAQAPMSHQAAPVPVSEPVQPEDQKRQDKHREALAERGIKVPSPVKPSEAGDYLLNQVDPSKPNAATTYITAAEASAANTEAEKRIFNELTGQWEMTGASPENAKLAAKRDAKAGMTGIDQHTATVSGSEYDFEKNKKTGLDRAWNQFEAGVVGSTGAAFSYIAKKGQQIGVKGEGNQALLEIGESMQRFAEKRQMDNPTYVDQLVQAFGSMGSFYIPGIGIAKGTEALKVLSPALAKWAGTFTSAGLESAMEAEGVYRQKLAMGASEAEAMDAADKAFLANLPYIAATDRIGLFNDIKGLGGRVLTAKVTEGSQEVYQQVVSNYFTGNPDVFEGGAVAGSIGALVGGGAVIAKSASDGTLTEASGAEHRFAEEAKAETIKTMVGEIRQIQARAQAQHEYTVKQAAQAEAERQLAANPAIPRDELAVRAEIAGRQAGAETGPAIAEQAQKDSLAVYERAKKEAEQIDRALGKEIPQLPHTAPNTSQQRDVEEAHILDAMEQPAAPADDKMAQVEAALAAAANDAPPAGPTDPVLSDVTGAAQVPDRFDRAAAAMAAAPEPPVEEPEIQWDPQAQEPERQPPLPERPEALAAQVDAMLDPESGKDTVLITPGAEMPPNANAAGVYGANMGDMGVVLTTNPEKAKALEEAAANGQLNEDTIGQVLYGIPGGKPADATHVTVLEDADGEPIVEIVTGPSNQEAVTVAVQNMARPTDKIVEKDVPEVLAGREPALGEDKSGPPAAMDDLGGGEKCEGGACGLFKGMSPFQFHPMNQILKATGIGTHPEMPPPMNFGLSMMERMLGQRQRPQVQEEAAPAPGIAVEEAAPAPGNEVVERQGTGTNIGVGVNVNNEETNTTNNSTTIYNRGSEQETPFEPILPKIEDDAEQQRKNLEIIQKMLDGEKADLSGLQPSSARNAENQAAAMEQIGDVDFGNFTVVSPSELPNIADVPTAQRDSVISREAGQKWMDFARDVLGLQVVFYTSDNPTSPDGFKLRNDNQRRVYVKANGSTINPAEVLGHEFFHTTEEGGEVDQVYQKVVTGAGLPGIISYSLRTGYTDEAPGEMTADLAGNLLAPLYTRPGFWDTVFSGVRELKGAEKSRRIASNFAKAVGNKVADAFSGGNGYDTGGYFDAMSLAEAQTAIVLSIGRHYLNSGATKSAASIAQAKAAKDIGIQLSKPRTGLPPNTPVYGVYSPDNKYLGHQPIPDDEARQMVNQGYTLAPDGTIRNKGGLQLSTRRLREGKETLDQYGAKKGQRHNTRALARVNFEVAPDPNDAKLSGAWNRLNQADRRQISAEVASQVIPRALGILGLEGSLRTQIGSYENDTNPSFALELSQPGRAAEAARFLGYVLSQDSMVVVSDESFDGADRVGAVTVDLMDKDPEQVYNTLREIVVDYKQPVGGQSTVNGKMLILNYSDVSTSELARLVDEKLGGGHEVEVRHGEAYAYFPSKEEYGYGGDRQNGATDTGRAPIERDADYLRREATGLVRDALRSRGIQTSIQRGSAGGAAPGDARVSTPPVREDGRVELTHWSGAKGLQALDPAYHGKGLSGAERKRKQADPDNWVNRTYYGIAVGQDGGYVKEQGLGNEVYTAAIEAERLYDLAKDPDGLRNQPTSGWDNPISKYEKAIKDAGYAGYWVNDRSLGLTAAVYEKLAVENGATGELNIEEELYASDPVQFSRSRQEPKKTVKAYKLFRMDPRQAGKLFPLFVDAKTAVPIGAWIEAADVFFFIGENGRPYTPAKTGGSHRIPNDEIKAELLKRGLIKSMKTNTIKAVAYRPGWHAGDLPFSTHLGYEPKLVNGKRVVTVRGDDQVWAEVEMPDDVDWQTEATKRGTGADGKFKASEAHITDQMPAKGFYRYKTNPNMTGNWMIGGSIKITRILSDDEVKQINDAAGVADLPRNKPLDLVKYGFKASLPRRTPGHFFSPLGRAVEGARQETMPAQQWKLWLQANKGKLGLKDDEIVWSGINEYLDLRGKDKVTKAEISDYLTGNGVRVEDVVKGYTPNNRDIEDAIQAIAEADGITQQEVYEEYGYENEADYVALAAQKGVLKFKDAPKFASYWDESYKGGIPGTYREILVTLPQPTFHEWYPVNYTKPLQETTADEEAAARLAYHEKYGKPGFKSSHWDEPNVLVHVRLDEVTGADGKRYVRVGEIQSDWGQDGKKNGFAADVEPTGKIEIARDGEAYVVINNGLAVWSGLSERRAQEVLEQQQARGIQEGPRKTGLAPPAPFVTDTKAWVALGIKRAIIHAAEVDADGVVFGTGEQNANLYSLEKQVSAIEYQRNENGTGRLTADDLGGNVVIDKRGVKDADLPGIIGKEAAERLLKQDPMPVYESEAKSYVLDGENLKVGGEGMKAFYDKIVPQVANDVLKKLGLGKVESVALPGAGEGTIKPRAVGGFVARVGNEAANWSTREDAEAWVAARQGTTQPGFEMTDAIYDKLGMEYGQLPLFSKARAENVRWMYANRMLPRVPGRDLQLAADQRFRELVDKFNRARDTATDREVLNDVLPSTPMPSVLHMVGAPNQWLAWHGGILAKVLSKHAGVDPASINDHLRNASMVFRTDDGQYEIVTDWLDADNQPLFAAVKVDVQESDGLKPDQKLKVAVVKSAYHINLNREFVDGGWKDGLLQRIATPKGRTLVYADETKAFDLFKRVGAEPPRVLVEEGLRERNIAGWLDLVKFLGDEYKGPEAQRPAFSAPRTQVGQSELPAETRGQAVQRVWQDRYNRFQKLNEWVSEHGDWLKQSGINFEEFGDADVYHAEERLHGRFSTRAGEFRERVVQPLVQKTKDAGLNMDQMAAVLHAMHAPERNAQIARINPTMPDGGSGMTDADAHALLAGNQITYDGKPMQLTPAQLTAAQGLADQWRAIAERTKQILRGASIIDQDTVDAWDNAYRFYVPLKGGVEDDAALTGTGKGLTVKAKLKRALGHSARPENILENMIRDHERALLMAEKNRVGKHLLRMAIVTRDLFPGLFTVDQPRKRAVLMPDRPTYEVYYHGTLVERFDSLRDAQKHVSDQALVYGRSKQDFTIGRSQGDPQVQYMARPMLEPNETQVYVNGQAVRVQINDELLARAYNSLGVESLGAVLRAAREFNRWLSHAYTGYNPEFFFDNLRRDFTSGLVNITSRFGAGTTARAVARYPRAFMEMLRYSMSGNATPEVREYVEQGGGTGAAYLSDLERIGSDIREAYEKYIGALATFRQDPTARGAYKASRAAFKKLIGTFMGWMDHINTAGENSMRMALYHALRDAGVQSNEAASASKNVTVNFNRQGEITNKASALYLFFNPNVQGTANLINALTKGKHRAQGWALLSSLAALYLLQRFQFDDDEWGTMDTVLKERNFLIRIGDQVLPIPLPYGHGWFINLAARAHDLFQGKPVNEVALHTTTSFFEHFSPVGNPLAADTPSWSGLVHVLPLSPVKMSMQSLVANENGFGQQIVPDSPFDESKPDMLRKYRSTIGTPYDVMAKNLSDVTGGTDSQAGWVDVSPEMMKFWWSGLTGGTGRFLVDAPSAAINASRTALEGGSPAESMSVREVPIARKVVRDMLTVQDYRNRLREMSLEVKTDVENMARAKKMADSDALSDEKFIVEGITAENLNKMLSNVQKSRKMFSQAADAILADDTLSAAKKKLMLKDLEMQEREALKPYLDALRGAQAQ